MKYYLFIKKKKEGCKRWEYMWCLQGKSHYRLLVFRGLGAVLPWDVPKVVPCKPVVRLCDPPLVLTHLGMRIFSYLVASHNWCFCPIMLHIPLSMIRIIFSFRSQDISSLLFLFYYSAFLGESIPWCSSNGSSLNDLGHILNLIRAQTLVILVFVNRF